MKKPIIITISNMNEDLSHGEHIITYGLKRKNLPKLKKELKLMFKQDRKKEFGK